MLFETQRKRTESIYEVNLKLGRANSSISHQLRYIHAVSWIGGNVAVHKRKVDNPECKVIPLIVDTDTERCGYVGSLDIRVETLQQLMRKCPKFQFRRVNCADVRKSIATQSFLQEKNVYLVDVLSFVQKVRKLLVAMKLFPLVLKTLCKRSWSCFLSLACGRLV